jgi:nucleoside 2-deoxyribosyltransferase
MNGNSDCKAMKTIIAYLAHSSHEKEEGLALQRMIEALGVKVINPFQTVEQGQKMSYIVEKELQIIRNVDIVITYITDKPTIGAHMEAMYAFDHEVPLFVLWQSTRSKSWYGYIPDFLTEDTETLLKYIEEYVGK